MKTKYSIFAILLVLSLILASCAQATPQPAAPAEEKPADQSQPQAQKTFTMFMMPKVTGNPYFEAAKTGADEAAKELGVNLIWQAPSKGDPNEQIELIQSATAQKVDVILVSATDKQALLPIMQQAMKAGILVMTWDADVDIPGRNIFVNQSSLEGIGRAQAEALGKMMNYEGEFGIVSSTTTAPNQTAWIEWMFEEWKDPKYAKMKYTETVYGGDMDETAYQAAQGLLKAHPNLKGIVAPGSTMIAATARAVKDKDLCGKVLLTGLGVPSEMRTYVKDGCVPAFVLWSPPDLGYLAVHTAYRHLNGEIKGAEGDKFTAGKLGDYSFGKDGEVVLGPGYIFDLSNIDKFDF